jgi:glycosyltransferase involved in cell wall biosynthesis
VELPLEVRHLGGGRELTREQAALPRLLSRLRADVLLSPANRGLPLVSPCPMVLVLFDLAEWDRTLVAAPRGAAAVRFAYSNAVSLSRAARIVTTSEYSRGAITRTLGIADDRIRVVPGGIEERFLADPGDEAVARTANRHGVAPGSVLHVGSLQPRKDLSTLVRAVAALPAALAPRLVLAGTGPEAQRLRALGDALGLGDRLHLAGFVDDDDLPALYRAAGCVVLAGTGEGFGLPALEAMAAGTPVVAARAGSLPEVVGEAGRLFPAGDPAALATTLQDVLGAPGVAAGMGAAGRARAAAFSWDRVAQDMDRVLREALDMGRSARAWSEVRSLRSLPRWLRAHDMAAGEKL